ncbi:MAG: hypothetical protein FJX77_03130 [Armatimonadetes bacterium]|nr:hypothetical protein [Armatimonadota bacterium]
MKCIHCGEDTNYKARSISRRCQRCQHPFAFEPKSERVGTAPLADGLFHRAIQEVSEEGKLQYTERQLWFALSRRLVKRQTPSPSALGCFSVLAFMGAAIALALGTGQFWIILVAIPLAFVGLAKIPAFSRPPTQESPLPFPEFQRLAARWKQTHGPLTQLAAVQRPSLPDRAADSDLTAYSFDRVVVTERADLAAMLVANRFHFENNCAILSLDGYPAGMADTIMTMLRRNPVLKVFAIHDASVAGCLMARTLRGPNWFPDANVQILDLGLRPKHAQALKLLVTRGQPQALSEELRATLTQEEAAWLEAGNSAELSALRPSRLMRALYQGFARANQIEAAGDDGIVGMGPGFIWIGDPTSHVYASDSFG